MSAGSSKLGLSGLSSGSIDISGEQDEDPGGQLRRDNAEFPQKAMAPWTPNGSLPSFPQTASNYETNTAFLTDDIEITGSKFGNPSNHSSQSFRQHNGFINNFTSIASGPSQLPYTPLLPPSGQGWASGMPAAGPSTFAPNAINTNGFAGTATANGGSSSSAIDLTNVRLPSPPPVSDKRPICIGSLQSRVIMVYPSHAAVIGAQAPEGAKERYQTVIYRKAELLKVKLKVSRAKQSPLRLMPLSCDMCQIQTVVRPKSFKS